MLRLRQRQRLTVSDNSVIAKGLSRSFLFESSNGLKGRNRHTTVTPTVSVFLGDREVELAAMAAQPLLDR